MKHGKKKGKGKQCRQCRQYSLMFDEWEQFLQWMKGDGWAEDTVPPLTTLVKHGRRLHIVKRDEGWRYGAELYALVEAWRFSIDFAFPWNKSRE